MQLTVERIEQVAGRAGYVLTLIHVNGVEMETSISRASLEKIYMTLPTRVRGQALKLLGFKAVLE